MLFVQASGDSRTSDVRAVATLGAQRVMMHCHMAWSNASRHVAQLAERL